jgi:hypothetical protein
MEPHTCRCSVIRCVSVETLWKMFKPETYMSKPQYREFCGGLKDAFVHNYALLSDTRQCHTYALLQMMTTDGKVRLL